MNVWKHSLRWFLLVCADVTFTDASSQNIDQTVVLEAAESIIRQFSSSSNLTNKGLTNLEFQSFLESVTFKQHDAIQVPLGKCPFNTTCTQKIQCPGTVEIFQTLATGNVLTPRGLIYALPLALNTLTSENCTSSNEDTHQGRGRHKPSMAQALGYGAGFATLMILLSTTGACLGPTMGKRFFRRILQFLVAMGAGSLTSTSFLVLIPEALHVVGVKELDGYLWKATVAVISIYFFFCLERIMRTCMYRRKKLNRNISIIVDEPEKLVVDDTSSTPLNNAKPENYLPPKENDDDNESRQTLAWMVMAGDVIHNFVDGLSIGAAFTEDKAIGISISLAVICEALPHELADVAILLHSGMSMKKALLINFLSACTCYLGLALSVTAGSLSGEATTWIFAMASGLFLYVPLVDMLPDMSAQLETLTRLCITEAKIIVFLHACGLTVGAGIIMFIVYISPYVTVD